MATHYTLNGRIWIDTPDGKVIGHGRVELLERIHATGSLRQAALQMKMSYKQAWDLVKNINQYIGEPVVISYRGGKGGGKAVVTDKGLHIIKEFRQLEARFREFLDKQTLLMKI
jgi:molybdate transport system regulatory protein